MILLDRRLSQRERRSRLAHELAHIEAGDTCCDVDPDGPTPGSAAGEPYRHRAARRLITLDQLADALVWCLGYEELAEHLHVDERTVRARSAG